MKPGVEQPFGADIRPRNRSADYAIGATAEQSRWKAFLLLRMPHAPANLLRFDDVIAHNAKPRHNIACIDNEPCISRYQMIINGIMVR